MCLQTQSPDRSRMQVFEYTALRDTPCLVQKIVHVVLVDDGAQRFIFVVRYAKQPGVRLEIVNLLFRL